MRASAVLAIFALATACSLASVQAADFEYCSDVGSVTISNITLDPEQPVPGGSVVVYVAGETDNDVPAATVSIDLDFGNTPLLRAQDLDVCELIDCPVPAGPFEYVVQSPALPDFTPVGDYTLTLNFADPSSAPLLCVQVNATVAAASASY